MPLLDWLILIVGTGLGVVSLAADMIGLGSFPGFGWKQVLGTAVGLLLVLIGGVRIVRRERSRRP